MLRMTLHEFYIHKRAHWQKQFLWVIMSVCIMLIYNMTVKLKPLNGWIQIMSQCFTLICLPGTWLWPSLLMVMHVTELCVLDIKKKKKFLSLRNTRTTWKASPSPDGSHQLLSWGEAPQSGCELCHLQDTMLSGQSVHVRESKIDQRSWIPYHQPAYVVQPHTSMTMVKRSLVSQATRFYLAAMEKTGVFSTAVR